MKKNRSKLLGRGCKKRRAFFRRGRREVPPPYTPPVIDRAMLNFSIDFEKVFKEK